MTLPMTPAPALSTAAQPYARRPLPVAAPDESVAYRAFSASSVQGPGPLRDRDLRERELLGMAMANPQAAAALAQLAPKEFVIPVNQVVARTILELRSADQPHDAAAVSELMLERGELPKELRVDSWRLGAADPREVGLGAWQTIAVAPAQRAPGLAREVRSLHRQDTLLQVATTALRQWQAGLSWDPAGRLEADQLGEVTHELATQLVSLPKELHPELGVSQEEQWSRSTPETPTAAQLPPRPMLSASAEAILRRT